VPATKDERSPVDQGDRWTVPVGEGIVTQLQVDFAFGLTVETWLHFRIETPFRYGGMEYQPEDSSSLAPLLRLHQARVASVEVFKDGRLAVGFADGQVLTVAPIQQYEAFEVHGQSAARKPFQFVALPGGGLAEWL
jgi:hypothetical protein